MVRESELIGDVGLGDALDIAEVEDRPVERLELLEVA